ncbi:MAG: ferredoxin family protein [Ferrimicrobium sp.]
MELSIGSELDAALAQTTFVVDSVAHIVVDSTCCLGCSMQPCVVTCPAGLFRPLASGSVLFNYEGCFECGLCRLVCPEEGAITWSYPRGGMGVQFHHG